MKCFLSLLSRMLHNIVEVWTENLSVPVIPVSQVLYKVQQQEVFCAGILPSEPKS